MVTRKKTSEKKEEKTVEITPKKTDARKGAKLPNTRGDKVVSTVTSEKPTKPQRKATGEVKKIDEKGKM